MAQTTTISVEGRLAGLEGGHSARLDALAELFEDLRSLPELGAAERDADSHAGKGAITELVVTLGSSGSIAAFVRLVRIWLERDRRRSVTVSITEQETGRVIKVEGENISIGTLTEALAISDRRPGSEKSKAPGRGGK